MDCVCEDTADTLQSRMTSFVWVKHSHRALNGLLSKQVWDCSGVDILEVYPLKLSTIIE